MAIELLGWVGLFLASGCSFVFVTTPPDQPKPVVRPRCTSSQLAPGLDALMVAYQGVRTGFALVADDEVYEDAPISREVDVGFGLGFAALFAASSVYGIAHTTQCAKLKQRYLDPEESTWEQPSTTRTRPGAMSAHALSPDPRIASTGAR